MNIINFIVVEKRPIFFFVLASGRLKVIGFDAVRLRFCTLLYLNLLLADLILEHTITPHRAGLRDQ